MPEITFMCWNIQDFGAQRPCRGNYVALCNFIARVAFNQRVDILAILELRDGGIPYLADLASALNEVYNSPGNNAAGNWYYDCIGGAIKKGEGNTLLEKNVSPKTNNNIVHDKYHFENYALFWNHARNEAFTVLETDLPCRMACSPHLLSRVSLATP